MSAVDSYPKSAYGINRQEWVHNDTELLDLVSEANGVCSVFVSHNSYPSLEDQVHESGNHICPDLSAVSKVSIDKLYIDLDEDRKLEHAHYDIRKAVWRAEEEGWKWWGAFSGKKGFQFIIELKPEVKDISEKVDIGSGVWVRWSSFYRAVHTWLAHECDKCEIEHPRGLNLRTLDFNCAEPKHIMRVWNTMHFSRGSQEPTGTYCIPLTMDQILNLSTEEIVALAENPVLEYDDYRSRKGSRKYLHGSWSQKRFGTTRNDAYQLDTILRG